MPRLTAAYHKVREETKDWGDYEKLPKAIPEFPLIRRMLLGAVSVVQTPRLRAFETNERRVGNFVGTLDPYFVEMTDREEAVRPKNPCNKMQVKLVGKTTGHRQ